MPHAAVQRVLALLEQLGEHLPAPLALAVSEKEPANLVTDLDLFLEERLRKVLPTLWPGSVVVGEEGGGSPAEWTWWVDPLDGTTNRVHGWPRSAISVALYQGERAVLGAVRDPYLGESFWAVAGEGAWLGGRRLEVRSDISLVQALLCTGFAPEPPAQWELCRRLQGMSRGLRVSGCASLDFAYVAAGRVELFLELDLKAWDVAAGMLLVREAGGEVLDYRGAPARLSSGNFVAGSGALALQALAEIQRCGLG